MRPTSPAFHVTGLLAALAGFASAESVQEALSFGHRDSLSPNLRAIPGWHISQEGNDPPQLLSDRIVLTPPYPGNRRSALWGEQKVRGSDWTADFEFRATGPERGGGNLQIWYARDGQQVVGTASVYTVHNFDGLVLTVDTYGGKGGSIRAFLNDGSIDYKGHQSVDSLSFGHCDYPYRNLGRLTKLQLKHTWAGIEVTVDGRTCFKSDQVRLPPDYNFGVSAASAETPDSFEAYTFIVRNLEPSGDPSASYQGKPNANPEYGQAAHAHSPQGAGIDPNQLLKLEDKLQELLLKLDALENVVKNTDSNAHNRHQETIDSRPKPKQLDNIDGRLQVVERVVQAIKNDVEGRDYKGKLDQIQQLFEASHSNLMTNLPTSMGHIVNTAAPRMWVFVSWIVVIQLILALSYVAYKRKRANAPKKYL